MTTCQFGDETAMPGEDPVHALLRQHGQLRTFNRNDVLLMVGTSSDEVLLIESGVIKVVLTGIGGTELLLGFRGPGEIVGELGVLAQKPRSATVIAHTDGSAIHVPSAVFLRLAQTNNDVLFLVNKLLQQRLRNADDRGLSVAFEDVPTRVVRQLLNWADSQGLPTNRGLTIRGVSQKDLAQAIGASAKTVDAALKRLRALGLVETGRLRYVLPDPEQLRDFFSRSA